MLEIKNLLFQPLTLHLKDSTKSVHLNARGKATIKDDEISEQISKAQSKGWLSINSVDAKKESAKKKGGN